MANDKLLQTAKDRFKMAIEALSESRDDELDDLRFRAASPDNQWQWPSDVLASRGATNGQTINARPCLTINKLPQHVLQVTNDQRQNRPAGKVIPVDDKADIEVAEMLDGIVRHIEYISDADVVYDTACDNQVTFGEGYFRILTEYCDEFSFEQDIKLGRIRNSFAVYMDPMMQDPCGADAQWCFISQDMTHEEFEREFPNATPVTTWIAQGVGDEGASSWASAKTIRIAEYFYHENEEKTICLYEGGEVIEKGSAKEQIAIAQGLRPVFGNDGKPMERQTTVKKVKWCKINGYEVLEESEWAGKYIPVIRVVGNEFEIEGRLYVSGLVRNAKDAQRMYNYWASQEVEMLALAPKAPFIGYGGQFEGYETQWKTANINNWPYLEVNPDAADPDGKPFPLPQRAMPPMPQAGIIQAKMGASDDIKGTTGQYDPTLGIEGSEKSGRAIIAREKQSDTGTYHYRDNLARAVRYGVRQIIDLVPKIYDTKRIARIVGLDGEIDQAVIDPMQPEPVKTIKDENGAVLKKIFNPSLGKYDVMVTTGPSYMTKRQEAMESMAQLLQGNPSLWSVAGDLFIKNMDWPGAQEMAKRFAKTISPEIMDDDADPGMMQAKKVIDGLQQQVQSMGAMLENVHKSMEAQQLQNDHFKADIQAYDAETKRLQALAGAGTPEEIRAVVMKTMQELLASPSLEQEEPVMLEQGEQHMQPGMGEQGEMPAQPGAY